MFLSQADTDSVVRIESIIAPATAAKRIRKRDADNPIGTPREQMVARFAHYTSSEAALNIIQTKRLWMRSTTCMIDFSEVTRGHQILSELFLADDGRRRAAFIAACDAVHSGAALAALQRFDQLWNNQFSRFRMYISSVCEHDAEDVPNGRLSMWRAFGTSPRVALVAAFPWYSDAVMRFGVFFSPVNYFDKGQFAADLDSAIENIGRETAFLKQLSKADFEAYLQQMVLTYVTCTKHEGFREEREWRAVFVPDLGRSNMLEHQVQAVGGVPQTIFSIPMDAGIMKDAPEIDLAQCLDRIIVGPTPYSWVQYEAFKSEFKIRGFRAEVISSPLPIRG
jgi:hypothetical protein